MTALVLILEVLLAIFAVMVLIPSGLLLVQSLVAMRSAPGHGDRDCERPSITVLIPAHDEESGIAATLASVTRQLEIKDRTLVVADNCSDGTAAVARSMGAEVLERHDPLRRGKGYALDAGVRHLADRSPDVVVIVDADCLLQPGCLDALSRLTVRTGRPVQAVYLMLSPAAANLKRRIAEFAWRVKNHARPLGMQRMGLPCELTGSGMAFPWHIIQAAPLATGHLVEDMQLGLDLGAAGTPPLFCPSAFVTSVFPDKSADAVTQRTRWEHGHLSVILAQGPRLLWRAIRERRGPLMAQVLDLCVPPLVMLLLLQIGIAAAAGALAIVTGKAIPVSIAMLGLLLLAAAIGCFWWRFGRDLVNAGELLKMPLYVGAKLPIYLKFLVSRQVEWVRTKRDDRQE